MLFWRNMNLEFAFQREDTPQLCAEQPARTQPCVPAWWRGLAGRTEKGLCGFLGRHSVNSAAPDGLFHTGPFEDTL